MFYYEEYILHERCRQQGSKIVFDPNASVVHGDAVATRSKTRSQRERIRFVMKNTSESARIYRDMLCKKKKVKHEKNIRWKENLRKITIIRLMLNAPLYLQANGWKKTIQYTQDVIWSFFGKNRNKIPRVQYNAKELEEQRKKQFKKNIKFSIVVPLYNTPISYLREMIESVQNQTYTNWEMIIVDDGSKDNSINTIKEYCENFAKQRNLRYISDDAGNVVIFKNASKDCDSTEPVIIQGHLDMVWEKDDTCSINFEND